MDRRIGFAIRYVPTYVRQIAGEDSATLVRGTDAHDNFEHEPVPHGDLEPAMLDYHKEVTARSARILYRGTGVGSYDDPRAVGLR